MTAPSCCAAERRHFLSLRRGGVRLAAPHACPAAALRLAAYAAARPILCRVELLNLRRLCATIGAVARGIHDDPRVRGAGEKRQRSEIQSLDSRRPPTVNAFRNGITRLKPLCRIDVRLCAASRCPAPSAAASTENCH